MRNRTLGLKMIVVLLGVAATFMVLLPALVIKDGSSSYTGLQVSLGHEFANLGNLASGQIEFSILNIIAYLLPLLGAVIMILIGRKSLLSLIVFIGAIIMLFFVPNFTVVTVTVIDTVNEVSVEWNYGLGLIAAGVLSSIAALLSILAYLVE